MSIFYPVNAEVESCFTQAVALEKAGDVLTAQKIYGDLLSHPELSVFRRGVMLLCLGRIEMKFENYSEAIRVLYESLRLYPGGFYAYNYLHQIYRIQRRPFERFRLYLLTLKNSRHILAESWRVAKIKNAN